MALRLTPRIDKLANEGIRFNNYNVECQCTPSRSAIMTGPHSGSVGNHFGSAPGPGRGWDGTARTHHCGTPLRLRGARHRIGIGKWHLGETDGRLPNDQGFDEWWGIKNTWDEAAYTTYPAI